MKKHTWIRSGTVFLSLVACVLAVEILLRLFRPVYFTGYVGAYQYDEEIGFRLKDGIHFLNTTDYQQEIRTNRMGTVNFQESFREYASLVFAIGDSYTQGTGLASDASYPFQLDLILNMEQKRYIPRYAVVNLGLASFGGRQALLTLKRYAQRIGKPKYVLYLGASNDYEEDLLFSKGYLHQFLVDGNPRFGVSLGFAQWLTNETEIGKRMKMALGLVMRNYHVRNDPVAGSSGPNPCIAALQEPVFQSLKALSEELGATLIVGWADSPFGPEDSYRWLKNWAGDNSVAFVDWYPAVRSALERIPDLPLFNMHSGGHYRSWVNQVIARAFAEQMER